MNAQQVTEKGLNGTKLDAMTAVWVVRLVLRLLWARTQAGFSLGWADKKHNPMSSVIGAANDKSFVNEEFRSLKV